MKLLLKNGKPFIGNRLEQTDLLIENGKIAKIGKIDSSEAEKVVDCTGKIILPGAIDTHVHFRIPGAEHKANWKTESKAALLGGITCVLDMPNNNPSIISQELLDMKGSLIGADSLIRYGLFIGATADNIEEVNRSDAIAVKIYTGSTTGNLLVDEDDALERIFSKCSKIIFVHAESEKLIKKHSKIGRDLGKDHAKYHDNNRPRECVIEATKKIIELAEKYDKKTVICHTNTKEEIDLIKKAKLRNVPVYCEVAPHHLFLSREKTEEIGNFAKMNPPLRERADNFALLDALNEGVVNFIGTDHAPHTKEEKEKDYWNAPSGVTGIDTSYALMLNAVNENKIGLKTLVNVMSRNAAKLLGLKKGKIDIGYDADLAVIDLEKEWTVSEETIHTKPKISPFMGTKLKGKVVKTILGGNLMDQFGEAGVQEKTLQESAESAQPSSAIGEVVAKTLLEIKAVALNPVNPYRYASGILSPIYCDNRMLMGYPEKMAMVRDYFIQLIKEKNLEFDVIAGTATAGIPHASWLSEKLGKPMIYVKKAKKEHGKENLIEGVLQKGQKVLVVEDLISTGGSSVAAVNAVDNSGGDVVATVAIFSYEMEKAKKKFFECGCPLYTLSNFSTLAKVAERENYVTAEQKNIILEWNKMPAEWGSKMGFE